MKDPLRNLPCVKASNRRLVGCVVEAQAFADRATARSSRARASRRSRRVGELRSENGLLIPTLFTGQWSPRRKGPPGRLAGAGGGRGGGDHPSVPLQPHPLRPNQLNHRHRQRAARQGQMPRSRSEPRGVHLSMTQNGEVILACVFNKHFLILNKHIHSQKLLFCKEQSGQNGAHQFQSAA